MNDQPKRLYRSETDSSVAGVCGGIAEYFNVDSTLVRLLFVLLTFAGGPGLLVYVLLWLVMPAESDVYGHQRKRKRKRDEF
jgi:phage shock protein C